MGLLNELNKNYKGWLEWEPETIREIITDDEVKFNKIMALQTVLNAQSDDESIYFTDWQIFEKIVLALNEIVPNFADIEEAEPHEIHLAYLFLEDIKGEVGFNDEVKKYIATSYHTNNIVYCPFYDSVNDFLDDSELVTKVKDYYEKIPWDEDEAIEKIADLDDNQVVVQVKKLIYIIQYTKKELE